VKFAVQCPTHEPSTIVPIITTATKYLGVGVTLSTAFEHPYSMVRRLSSLDHLSSGRIAWNIVSSYSKSEWDAYGLPMTERSGRYERLEEYMDVCYKLWNSWDSDAIIANKESGIYADPVKVREVDHTGTYYKCKARSFVAPSPQGYPVLWQAGSSDRGRDFAAKHAEAIFAVHPTVARMRQYADDVNNRLHTRFDRRPGSVKLIYGLQTVVAESRSEAQAKYERIKACIPAEGALAWMSGHFGLDFSKYDLDEHIQNIEVPGIQGLFESILYAKDGAPVTVREAAIIYAQGMGMPVLVGTAADIADRIEEYLDDGGADGFMLIATYTPGCYEEFVDFVVPELQRRGRYRTRYAGATLRENLLQY
jgi:FMN-dependent oxidoreductase (nitrilotriacetate monooxygenase family)